MKCHKSGTFGVFLCKLILFVSLQFISQLFPQPQEMITCLFFYVCCTWDINPLHTFIIVKRPLVVAFPLCMLADALACTHAVASVFIICACALWQSGKSTEGFPQRPRCRSVCSLKGKDHLPGLGEISATCRCWGIYHSTQGKKHKAGGGGVTTHREQGVWPRKFRPRGQVQHE